MRRRKLVGKTPRTALVPVLVGLVPDSGGLPVREVM
jgi:hypothetical protein